jgi:hypothetical protein
VLGEIDGRPLIFFCGGNALVYAFEPVQSAPPPGQVLKLKKVWQFDCDPTAPKENIHKYMTNRKVSPSNIKSMPVFCQERLFVTGGGDVWWGKNEAWLKCLNPRGAGDLTKTAELWSYPLDKHCMSTPSVWQGLVFAAIDATVEAFDQLVAGIEQRLGPDRGLAGYGHHHRVGYDLACNWKVYVDNYLEGYHVPHVHPELNRMLDYRSYVTETAPWHSLQWSPLESDATLYGNGDALYYWLWPNTMLNILPGRLQTNRVVPIAVDRCRIEFDFYYPVDDSDEGQARRAADLAFSDEVQQEDLGICVDVQRGLASGSYVPGRLNPLRETAVHHFQELLRGAYRDA